MGHPLLFETHNEQVVVVADCKCVPKEESGMHLAYNRGLLSAQHNCGLAGSCGLLVR